MLIKTAAITEDKIYLKNNSVGEADIFSPMQSFY